MLPSATSSNPNPQNVSLLSLPTCCSRSIRSPNWVSTVGDVDERRGDREKRWIVILPREEARASSSLHHAARITRGSNTSSSRVDNTKIISYTCAATSFSPSFAPLSPANIAKNGVKPMPPATHNGFLEEGHGVFDATASGDARNVKSPVIHMRGTLSWRGRKCLRSSPSFCAIEKRALVTGIGSSSPRSRYEVSALSPATFVGEMDTRV
ncbi:hypothetical protein BDN67DRAFT_105063 [Paxillus ammoniavirescens]|nr:hypothetical protein BDN67DRAFT_105063 [Paxillus ammoniavirescens]